MKPEALAKLPQLRRDYARNTDPQRDAARRHMEKPEAQRQRESVAYEARLKTRPQARIKAIEQDNERGDSSRGDSSRGETSRGDGEQSDGRGSTMVSRDRPAPALKPRPALARGVDAAHFRSAWLKEQRDAAMAAKANSHRPDHTQEPSQANTPQRQMREPER